jgi:hypothetical protein
MSQLEMQSVEVVAVYGETEIHEWGTNTNTSALNIKVFAGATVLLTVKLTGFLSGTVLH